LHLTNLVFIKREESPSPYINRFLSADTIVPSYANPQSLNRYSYVLNNPLRYTDPTGHRACDDYAGTCLSEHQVKHKTTHFAELFPGQVQDSWGITAIDPTDFEELLSEIAYDVHQKPPDWLVIISPRYDTPFYNVGGDLSGTGCIHGKCYTRTELNYIGEGELWAAVGVSKSTGHKIVTAWKQAKCAFLCNKQPSAGTLEMFDIGFDSYHELYPPGSPAPVYQNLMPWTSLGDS
jgi:hypothetical protein